MSEKQVLITKCLIEQFENVISDYEERELSEVDIEDINHEDLICILQALQEKAEREKGCEYCKGDLEGYTKPLPKQYGSHDMFVADGKCELKLFETKYKNNTAYINYCPMCGSKLPHHIGEANGMVKEETNE